MANMNLIGVFVTKLWPVQALACGGGGGDGGDGGGGGGGGATKTIISPKFSNFGDIIISQFRESEINTISRKRNKIKSLQVIRGSPNKRDLFEALSITNIN